MKSRSVALVLAGLLSLGGLVPTTAHASDTVVSFIMNDPLTGKPVATGAGEFILQKVNQMDGSRSTVRSGANGVTDLKLDSAFMYMVSPAINSSGRYVKGVFYLVCPQPDSSIKVLSADGEQVARDGSGNWIVRFPAKRSSLQTDPWRRATGSGFDAIGMLKLLPNGKVLASRWEAGSRVSWWLLTPDKTGDYLKGSWRKAAQPPATFNPGDTNSVILHSGNLLTLGAESNFDATSNQHGSSDLVLIYDVAHDKWLPQPSPVVESLPQKFSLNGNPTVELPNGLVMVTTNLFMPPTMIFDEKSASWTQGPPCCSNSESAYTLMQDDRVLHIDTTWDTPAPTQAYSSVSGVWTDTGKTPIPLGVSEIGPAISLMDGRVFATGATQFTALFDPKSNQWTQGPTFPQLNNGPILGAADGQLAVLPSGNVLISGSGFAFLQQPLYMSYMPPSMYFLFNPTTSSLTPVPDDPMAPGVTTWAPDVKLVVLPDGKVLVSHAGGVAVYSEGVAAQPQWRPVVEAISSATLSVDKSYTVDGRQLSGLTQGTQFGDELENPTNFPLVRVVNKVTGHVFYGTTSNYSSTSIAPMAPSSFDFTFGRSTENGGSRLYVVANGIASKPQDVMIKGGKALPRRNITCVKAGVTKRVVGVSPKCPVGFKLKK